MPLRCVDETGNDVYAFDISAEEWRALSKRNRESRTLRMPCCSAPVTLRRSSRGTQHFAHKAAGDCTTAPETEAHLRLKQIAVEVARKHGWDVKSEVTGTAPSGEVWIADVLAQKNTAKVAIEIQWSPQTNEETMRRQERYRQSGIRCLWLFRKPGFPVIEALPAAQVAEQNGTYHAHFSCQRMSVESLLDAAFGRRLRFGIPSPGTAFAQIRVGEGDCWKNNCRAKTRIVTGVDVSFGSYTARFSVSELGEYPALFEDIFRHLPHVPRLGHLKRRFSKTRERAYMSNGCYRCDSLFGDFYEFEAQYFEEVVSSFPIHVSPEWKQAIENSGYVPEWAVYSPAELGE
ncbi:hypothetical protein MZK49_08045 [Ensifer sesbaniae]|uniref:competence protein CoiA n=1 Tax=Ensifer sesbaniae TaxID=1214071 RepID=UPI0020018B16|nr:hypothetical protein [Ensifer sesbaniae]